jgi:hypothetical protein
MKLRMIHELADTFDNGVIVMGRGQGIKSMMNK